MKISIEIFLNKKDFAKILFLIGFFPLIFALISQYGFGLHPCELCIYQRIPLVIVSLIAVLLIIVKSVKIVLLGKVISAIALLTNSAIAFYHVGVEKHWWQHGDCSSSLDTSSLEALKEALFNTPAVRCDEVQFELFTLSMAGWNVLYCLAAAIFIMFLIFNDKADEHKK